MMMINATGDDTEKRKNSLYTFLSFFFLYFFLLRQSPLNMRQARLAPRFDFSILSLSISESSAYAGLKGASCRESL